MKRTKEGKVTPTTRQISAFKDIVINKINPTQAMRNAGYKESVATNPGNNLLRTDGFKQLCESLGFDQTLIIGSLKEDIQAKPANRVAELRLSSEILGLIRQGNTANAVQINIGQDRENYGQKSQKQD